MKSNITSQKKVMSESILRHLPPFILSIITALFYWPSLNYPFQFDDLANITKKFSIRNDNPISRLFSNSRWMSDWLNRLNYDFDRFNPFYYRLLNLAIHITAGIFLFYLILLLCEKLKKSNFLNKNSIAIAFTTAGLFLLHPVQTQTVSYVIQGRLEGLASLFVIANLFILINGISAKNLIAKIILFSFSALITLLSYGTKEIVVVTPLLLIICDWFFLSDGEWNNFKKRIYYHLSFFVIFYGLFFLRFMNFSFFTRAISLKMVTANNRGNILTDTAQQVIKPLEFFISEFKVIVHYFFMFIWPFGISVEYDWKLSPSFFSPQSFFPFLLLVGILSLAIYFLIKNKNKFITFGLFWFFITLAPRTTIIPSPELLCDYKTYLASVGWLFIIAVGIVKLVTILSKQSKNIIDQETRIAQFAILLIVFIPIATATYFRNTVWRTGEEFWGDIVKKAPNKARGHNNYGVCLSEVGKIDESIKQYIKAIALDRYYSDPLSNLAVAYSLKGETDKAIHSLQQALMINPNYPEAYNNIGTLLLNKKEYEKAEEALDNAIALRRYYGKAYYNKGRLYVEKGEEEKAWEFFKKATEGDLDTTEGFYTLGQLSIKLQKYEEAAGAFQKIISLGENNPMIHFNLANSYYMLKEFDKAENIYERLVQDNPTDTRFVYNLAETYLSKDKPEQALSVFQKVTQMPNAPGQAHLRIVTCLEKLEKESEVDTYLEKLLQAKAPENFKQAILNQKAQIELQRKVKSGNGSIKMSDLKQILAKAKPIEDKEDKKA